MDGTLYWRLAGGVALPGPGHRVPDYYSFHWDACRITLPIFHGLRWRASHANSFHLAPHPAKSVILVTYNEPWIQPERRDAMNDATELESSLAGAIDFFQNLRRKLGTLETDVNAQHDQIHTLSSTLVTLKQDRQTDRQTLANLNGGLVKLQADDRLLEQQLNAVETRVASFQQDQQQIRQTLSAMEDDLRAQGADWRQELEITLTQRLAPVDKIVALEQTARANQEQFEQFATIVEAQYKRLLQFDITLENLDQNNRSLNQTLGALKTDFERHERVLSALEETAGADEAARRQLQTQQNRLDALTASSTAAEQNLQAARQDIAHLKGEFETQHRMQADIAQIRQELQKHQDRLKYLETLMSKVSADTNSTRQILNVIQSDLTTQNDTLRELDQNWRDSLATYQDRLSSVEITLAGSGSRPATFLTEASSPSTVQPESAPADADAVLDRLQAGMLEEFQKTTHQQLTALSATLDAQQQDLDDAVNQIADLQQDVRQLQQPVPAQTIDPQRLETAEQYAQEIRQDVATRLDEQQKRWTELAATVETIRADSKATQETVVTMASNVVKWIHKIQNLLAATENTQSERLQEIEQKLIHLQAAFETLENQRKPRKWFSMPASLTAIMLIVGASGLAILVQVIWTIH